MQNSQFTLHWLNIYEGRLAKILQIYFVATTILGVAWYIKPELKTLIYLSGLAGVIGLGFATFCFVVLAKMLTEDAKVSSAKISEGSAGFDITVYRLYLTNGIFSLLIGTGSLIAFFLFK